MSKTVNKKKLFIYSDLPYGGGRRLFETLIAGLKDYSLIVVDDWGITSKFKGLIWHYIGIIYNFLYLVPKYEKLANSSDLVVVFQSWMTHSPMLLSRITKPTIYICNEVPTNFYIDEITKNQSFKEKIINKILLAPIKHIDKYNLSKTNNLQIVTVSRLSERDIYRVYNRRSLVVHPGISISRERSNTPIWSKRKQVITVGALNDHKNQLFILKVISRLVDKPRVNIVCNGYDERYKNELVKYARSNNIDLNIYVNVSEKKLVDLYRRSRLFLYSPKREPYGLVALEAIREGLPIVANNVGGYTEVLDKTNGIFTTLDINQWSNHVRTLLSDDQLSKKYSRNNQNYAYRLTEKQWIKSLISIIEKSL